MMYIQILKAMRRAMIKAMSNRLTIEEKSSSIGYLMHCTEYNDETIEKLARTFLDHPEKRERVLIRIQIEIDDLT